MCAQEQLLEIALAAAAPSAVSSSASSSHMNEHIARLQDGLIAAVAVAQSLVHDNAAIEARAAERDAQVRIRCASPRSVWSNTHELHHSVTRRNTGCFGCQRVPSAARPRRRHAADPCRCTSFSSPPLALLLTLFQLLPLGCRARLQRTYRHRRLG